MTPLSRAKQSLMVKIKEIYLPEEYAQFVEKEDDIDFTGAKENDQNPAEQVDEIDFT